MTRRSLFRSIAGAFAGSVLAKTALAGPVVESVTVEDVLDFEEGRSWEKRIYFSDIEAIEPDMEPIIELIKRRKREAMVQMCEVIEREGKLWPVN